MHQPKWGGVDAQLEDRRESIARRQRGHLPRQANMNVDCRKAEDPTLHSGFSGYLLCRPAKIVHQNAKADQKHPQWENDEAIANIVASEQEYQVGNVYIGHDRDHCSQDHEEHNELIASDGSLIACWSKRHSLDMTALLVIDDVPTIAPPMKDECEEGHNRSE
jgi:hypothetical protein